MPIVFLDSNIYRQMGLKFKSNVDYQNLAKILDASGNEFGLLKIVLHELSDYFQNELFASISNDYEKAYKRYKSNTYLDNINFPDISTSIKNGVDKLIRDLREKKYYWSIPSVETNILLNFLIYNKRTSRKDNTRDFLIFFSLIKLCIKHKNDHIILISNDGIFSSNEFFKTLITEFNVKNIKFFKSVPEFLRDFGPKLDFLTEQYLITLVNRKVIEAELLKDIKCLPGYVSEFYYEMEDDAIPGIEKLEINDIKINDFYVIKDYTSDKLKVNVTLKVSVNAIFKPEKDIEGLKSFLSRLNPTIWDRHSNTFTLEFGPVFNRPILFIFDGDIENNTVSQLNFIDFIPDYYFYTDIDESALPKMEHCVHIFDNPKSFLANPIYGGGLTWHARCVKCGMVVDTGEYYD